MLELLYDARGAGRVSRLTLLMDPRSGAALQRTQHDQQGKQRFRTYRFGRRRRLPAHLLAGERQREVPDARPLDQDHRGPPRLPDSRRVARPVVEPTGLLYAVAAASLDKPGDTLDVLVFRRRDTQVVRIEVLPPREISVQYDELWPKGAVQRSGKVRPLRLSLQGLPVPGGDPEDDDLELLGLRGRLELLLDPATRAPLQLSGNVKIVGTVTLRLAAVRPR